MTSILDSASAVRFATLHGPRTRRAMIQVRQIMGNVLLQRKVSSLFQRVRGTRIDPSPKVGGSWCK